MHTHRNSEGRLPQSPETTAINSANDDTHILAPAAACGKNVTARIAAKLDVAQISGIKAVGSADTFERPTCSGNAIATVQPADAILGRIEAAADLLGGGRRQWKMARSLLAEWQKQAENPLSYGAKIATAQFFAEHVLPQAAALEASIVSANGDAGVLALSEDQF